jgi:hypothetical protein
MNLQIGILIEGLSNNTFLVTHGQSDYGRGGIRAAFVTLQEAEDYAAQTVRNAVRLDRALAAKK